ncbi:phage virion morphogenesis protein [Bradyrhizobium sp. BRP05]|nr:phage virion morphogenesis protein [Bradyrhizobium sp. BRP05]
MPGLQLKIDVSHISKLTKRINRLLHQSENLSPVMRQAAEYMVNSTRNRILRTKRGPDGEKWAAISELTAQLKGSTSILFEHGDLARGIRVGDVSSDGFMIISDAEQSQWLQEGVRRVKGRYRPKKPAPQIPPRPFMGFSQENNARIASMIRDYLGS